VSPGTFLLAKESKHSYTVKQIRDTGVPVLYYSTQANASGVLRERSWPSVGYLFSAGVKPPSGIRAFRRPEDLLRPAWEVPGYSEEQYHVPASRWVATMQRRLSLRQESGAEALTRLMIDVCQLATQRVELVNNAVRTLQRIGNRCLNPSEYDDLSTPSRDRQLKDAYAELANGWSRVQRNRVDLPRDLEEQVRNIFVDTGRESRNQFCPVTYARGRTITLGELRRRLLDGRISPNPHDPLEVRWGEVQGPSRRARDCPQY
jgi:hypothetical protein